MLNANYNTHYTKHGITPGLDEQLSMASSLSFVVLDFPFGRGIAANLCNNRSVTPIVSNSVRWQHYLHSLAIILSWFW